jgi:DNA repair photolyase
VIVREIQAKSILSKSGIPGKKYCVNPYVGCGHGCLYCYATFMKRYTGHQEEWGQFADVRRNAAELLKRQIIRAKKGAILLGSVTDAYQPIEAEYEVTRACLKVLANISWPVEILTKSPLVLRDIDIMKGMRYLQVGLTITTDNDRIRKLFEPGAPSINERITALKVLHENGLKPFVFIAPMLPLNPEALAAQIAPYADRILIDQMNYRGKTSGVYRSHNLYRWLDDHFIVTIVDRLKIALKGKSITEC